MTGFSTFSLIYAISKKYRKSRHPVRFRHPTANRGPSGANPDCAAQAPSRFNQSNSRDCSGVIRRLSKPIFRGGNRSGSLPAAARPSQKMSSILENFEPPSDADGELKSHKVRSKQFLGGKVCHERTKTNSRCHHSQKVLALEGARPKPINVRPELSAIASAEELLAVVCPLPGDRSKVRAR